MGSNQLIESLSITLFSLIDKLDFVETWSSIY
jgi:hypothetical protein